MQQFDTNYPLEKRPSSCNKLQKLLDGIPAIRPMNINWNAV
jgi:hypothetical protein